VRLGDAELPVRSGADQGLRRADNSARPILDVRRARRSATPDTDAAEHADEYAGVCAVLYGDDHADADPHANCHQHADDHSHADGHGHLDTDRHADVDVYGNGYPNHLYAGSTHVYADVGTDEYTNGDPDADSDRDADSDADQHADEHTDEHTDADIHTDADADEHADGNADLHAEEGWRRSLLTPNWAIGVGNGRSITLPASAQMDVES